MRLLFCFLLAFGFLPEALGTTSVACGKDSDCVLVDTGCCGCNENGKSVAIHRSEREAYNKNLGNKCLNNNTACFKAVRCHKLKAQCQNSKCVAVTCPARRKSLL